MAKDTRQRILDAALRGFSEKGFAATSMAEIAAKVGIKAPSLYAHFKSKDDLFEALVAFMRHYFDASYASFQAGITDIEEAAIAFGTDLALAKQVAVNTFHFYHDDEKAGQFRRMLSMERYRNSEMDSIYRELYIDAPIAHQTRLLSAMMGKGVIRQGDAHTMALSLYAPIFLLIHQYDKEEESLDRAVEQIERHIQHFFELQGGFS